ncbi:MAG: nuclear transport factor 2 family protein [Terriglobales bacterium]
MKTVMTTMSLGLAALMLAACGQPATSPAADTNANQAKSTTPTADALLALDQQANEAYIKGDTKVFDGMLSDKFVMHEGGLRMDKAAVIKMIAGNKCDVRGWKLDDPQMAKIDADTYVLSYQGTFDGSCMGPDGKSMKMPSPIRAATVWVRSADKWLAAFHGDNLLIDPKTPPPPKAEGKKAEGNKEEWKKGNKSAADANAVATKPASDASSAAMMAMEKRVWEAWKDKDAKKLEALTAKDLAFQNIFGAYFGNKADTLKDWNGTNCQVKSVSVTRGVATALSPTVGILTHTATAEGTCGGENLTAVPVFGTSVYVREGDTWKLAFTLNQLD